MVGRLLKNRTLTPDTFLMGHSIFNHLGFTPVSRIAEKAVEGSVCLEWTGQDGLAGTATFTGTCGSGPVIWCAEGE